MLAGKVDVSESLPTTPPPVRKQQVAGSSPAVGSMIFLTIARKIGITVVRSPACADGLRDDLDNLILQPHFAVRTSFLIAIGGVSGRVCTIATNVATTKCGWRTRTAWLTAHAASEMRAAPAADSEAE
jgi:hypothetical protein